MNPVLAYLAPEIPALSATFVYHELLALRQRGFDVLPVSVHPPASPATEEAARALAGETILLYPQGAAAFVGAAVACKLRHPVRYLAACSWLLRDMASLGFFSRASAGLVYRFLAAAWLARLLEARGCRHLHVHFAHVPTDIAMYASKLAGISFSFTSHANDLFERGWLLKQKVERAARALTISEYNRRFLVSQGAEGSKIEIVRCGVEPNRFSPGQGGLPPRDVPVLGSLGRLVEKKGFDTLLAAAGLLARKGLAFRVEIAGDGPLLGELEAQAAREGVADRVAFLGPIANDEVPAWLARLDQFVLACRVDRHGDRDGIPVALMEAMAAGVPVVSTSVSAIPELIADGASGLVVAPADPTALADAVGRLLESEDLRRRCVAGGYARVTEEFSEEANARRLASLFHSLLSRTHQE